MELIEYLLVGDAYDISSMTDFPQEIADRLPTKIVQQNIKDIDDTLIKPEDMSKKLRPGTFVVALVEPVCWIFDGKGARRAITKVCHLQCIKFVYALT
jgi:hypothetical protein